MRRIKTKRTKIVVAATALVVVSGGAAFAYWTNSGSGTGSGATGTTSAITVTQTSVVSDLRPGGAAQDLSGTFTVPGDGPAYVEDLEAAVTSVNGAVGCEVDDYAIGGSPMLIQAQVDDATTWGVGAGGLTVVFVNEAAENQDGCKNATITISYTANAS